VILRFLLLLLIELGHVCVLHHRGGQGGREAGDAESKTTRSADLHVRFVRGGRTGLQRSKFISKDRSDLHGQVSYYRLVMHEMCRTESNELARTH